MGSKNKNISCSMFFVQLYHSSMRVIPLTKQALEQSRLLSLLIENPCSLAYISQQMKVDCYLVFYIHLMEKNAL